MFSDGPSVDQIALEKEKEPQPSTSGGQSSRSALEIDAPIRDDGFGGNLGQDIIGTLQFGLDPVLHVCGISMMRATDVVLTFSSL